MRLLSEFSDENELNLFELVLFLSISLFILISPFGVCEFEATSVVLLFPVEVVSLCSEPESEKPISSSLELFSVLFAS